MKISFVTSVGAAALMLSSVTSFAPPIMRASSSRTITTERFMFGGSGSGAVEEDDPEKVAAMEQSAKAMGISVEEYTLGLRARERAAAGMDNFRTDAGSNGIKVELDANAPPKHLVVTITEEARARGKEAVEKEIVAALKVATDASKTGRDEVQKEMMTYIAEQMKKIG